MSAPGPGPRRTPGVFQRIFQGQERAFCIEDRDTAPPKIKHTACCGQTAYRVSRFQSRGFFDLPHLSDQIAMVWDAVLRSIWKLDFTRACREQDFVPTAGVQFPAVIRSIYRAPHGQMRILPKPVSAGSAIDELRDFAAHFRQERYAHALVFQADDPKAASRDHLFTGCHLPPRCRILSPAPAYSPRTHIRRGGPAAYRVLALARNGISAVSIAALDAPEFRRAFFEKRLHALSIVRAGEADSDRFLYELGVAQLG